MNDEDEEYKKCNFDFSKPTFSLQLSLKDITKVKKENK